MVGSVANGIGMPYLSCRWPGENKGPIIISSSFFQNKLNNLDFNVKALKKKLKKNNIQPALDRPTKIHLGATGVAVCSLCCHFTVYKLSALLLPPFVWLSNVVSPFHRQMK